MRTYKYILVITLLMFSVSAMAQQDIRGSKDHDLISRYPGSVIKAVDVQEYDRYKIAIGPVTGYKKIGDWLEVEGKVTRIYYSLKSDRSVAEVFFNYQKAFKQNNFEILADGYFKDRNVGKTIGGRTWLGVYFDANKLPSDMKLLNMSSTASGSGFIAGKLTKGNAQAYVAVSITQFSKDIILYLIDVIEVASVEDDFIEVNAEIMKNKIEEEGKIALYGIFFDTNKADVKPESKPALNEIAKLLNENPSLDVYIVGHTDMTGSFDHNMSLSERRAKSVVDKLISDFGIDRSRLAGKGVGPLSPVATNINEDGRKLNRRVEIVGKL